MAVATERPKLDQLEPTVPVEQQQLPTDRADAIADLFARRPRRVNWAKLRASYGLLGRNARERRARDNYQTYLQTGRWPWQRGAQR